MVTTSHNQEVKVEESPRASEELNNLDSDSSKIRIQTSPSKCLEILDEPITPSSSALSLNSSPALSLAETQSPSFKAVNLNRKHNHTKRKISTPAPVYQNQVGEFTSALSPSISTSLNNDELTDTSQSSVCVARRWRRSLLSALSTVYSHRHAYVFMHPVTEDIAPGYSTVVYEPVDLTSLRRRMESSLSYLISSQQPSALNPSVSSYRVIIEIARRFIRDLLLMFMNARMYNSQNHEVHRMAGEMYHDVISELQPLWSIMAEDIPGFPSLPLLNLTPPQTTRSLQQSIVVSTAPTTSPSHPASCVLKDEESNASKQSSSFFIKQNKRSAPENHKTDHIPELSPHYSETHSDNQFGGNTYRMDPLLELELAKVRLAQTEREIELEQLRQKGREHYNQVVVDKAITYESTSASHAVDVPPGKDWVTMISIGLDLPKKKIIRFDGNPMNYWSFIRNFEDCFDESVGFRSRLNYLIQYCDGEAKATIVHCSLLEPEEGYRKALELLKEAFDQKHMVAHALIDKMLNIPAIKGTDPDNLRRLSREMHICELTLAQMNYVSNLNSTKTIECMFLKLLLHSQREWVKVACRILKTGKEPSFKDVCEFVKEQSDIANTRYVLLVVRGNNSDKRDVGVSKGKISANYNAARISYTSTSDGNVPLCSSSCLECSSNPSLDQCQKFNDRNVRERKEFGSSPSSPLPRKHRHSSGSDSAVGAITTRSK
ncbi:unnamed protein product [Schistosoma curassoni]|uniref:Bromo domain-containing protein n=1 Tax=Schistosoma curassoni TaxID=6186 RepID=A0A183KAK4_9TREM|nr:unnamed protein product [Schistosoma curassoni]